MAYSKAKLKSNGDRASLGFKPFLIGNISDKFLPTQTLLYVSVRHIFISLTSFLEIPNSMRIFIDFKKAYDSVRREALYSILILILYLSLISDRIL
jgi:hypothetical protein